MTHVHLRYNDLFAASLGSYDFYKQVCAEATFKLLTILN